MSGFAEFFEAKLAERERQIEAEKEAKEEARRQAKKRRDEVTKPFRDMYATVMKRAVDDLVVKGIMLEENPAPHDSKFGLGIHSQSFLLSFNSKNLSKIQSNIHGFVIGRSGIVEAFAEWPGFDRTSREAIFAKNIDDLALEDVEQVMKLAIENLISKI